MSTVAENSVENLVADTDVIVGSKIPVAQIKAFKYQPALDGLRAIAVLYVMGFHLNGPISSFVARGGGWVGVDVFFVISGFLITSILLQEQSRTGFINLKNFYLRRMLRLMPAYWAFLAGVAIFNPTHSPQLGAAIGIALVYLSNYDLVLGWHHTVGSGTDITWSLALEEQFYLIFPTILNFMHKHVIKLTTGGIIACGIWKAWLLTHGTSWSYLEAAFDTKVDTLMFGALGAAAYFNAESRSWLNKYLSSKWLSVALFASMIIFIRAIGHPSGNMSLTTQIIYWDVRLPLFAAISTALTLNLCLQSDSIIAKLLSLPVATWLGRLSYSLYLWHCLSLLAFMQVVKTPLEKWQLEIACYLTATGFACVSYYLIEKPFLKIKGTLK